MFTRKMRNHKLLSLLLVLSLTLSSGAVALATSAADPIEVVFYDEDGVTALATLPTTAIGDNGYIGWKSLNDVPDFNKAGDKIILSWKKKGDATDTRVNLSKHTARTNALAANIDQLKETLELVPLKVMDRAAFNALHYGNLLIDTHMDTPQRMTGSIGTGDQRPVDNNDLANPTNSAQGSYARMIAGGLTGGGFAAYTSRYDNEDWNRGYGDRANSRILAVINATSWSAERNPGMVEIVKTPADFNRVFAANKLSLLNTIEGAYSITEDNYYELIEQYYDLGVRILSFTHNPISYLATGINAYGANGGTGGLDTGMTSVGERTLDRMKDLGMVYDVSHASDQTVKDALVRSERPMIGSHSGAWGQHQHDRNIKDAEIIAMAKGGGTVQQNFYGDYMAEPRGVSEVADQIDYIRDLLEKNGFADGTDYIGLGADYDGGTNTADINDASYYFRITKELLARGYTNAEIIKIMNGNLLRVLGSVQAAAAPRTFAGTPATISDPVADGITLGAGTKTASLATRTPVFEASLGGDFTGGTRVVIDGIVRDSFVKGNVLTADLTGAPIQEEYHAVTFEATNKEGQITRETKIFRIGATAIHKVDFMDADRVTSLGVAYVPNSTRVAEADVPWYTADGEYKITRWTNWRTGANFNAASNLTYSYRLVAVPATDRLSADVFAPVDSDVSGDIEYTLALWCMENLLNLEIEFTINGDILSGKGIETLTDGFDAISDIKWSYMGDGIWKGAFTVGYTPGGVTTGYTAAGRTDLLKIVFSPRGKGSSDLKLTGVKASKLDMGTQMVVNAPVIIDEAIATTNIDRLTYSKYDLNKDGVIDALDLGIMLLYCGFKEEDAEWATLVKVNDSKGNPVTANMCDVNSDGMIDMLDLIDLFINYTK